MSVPLTPKTMRAVHRMWRAREAGAASLYPYREVAEYCLRRARQLEYGYCSTVSEYWAFLNQLASERVNGETGRDGR